MFSRLRLPISCLALVLWLASPPVFSQSPALLQLAADEAWQPFIEPQRDDGGLITELVSTVLARAGYQVEMHYLPWSEVLRDAASGLYAGVAGIYETPERGEHFLFSDPLLRFRVGFIARRDFPDHRYQSLVDLRGQVIGIVQDAAYPEVLYESGLTLHTSATRDGLIQMLHNGRIDLLADTEDLFRYQALRLGLDPDEFVMLSPLLEDEQLFFSVPRTRDGAAELIRDFNRGLAELRRDGTYLEIRRRHGF